MDSTKTCVLYRGLRENMKTFADRVAKKLDEMEKYDATIVYTGFLQDRISKARSTLEIKAGDKIIVGYDGLLHPLKNSRAALNIDSDIEVEGYSATGLSEFLVAWLDSSLDLTENLRRSMLDLNDVKSSIENALLVIGMKKETPDNE